MRVRYIAHHQNYIWYGQVSIPAVGVRYIMKWRILINGKHGVSIPAARVRYIISIIKTLKEKCSFNSRGAGKIHQNEEDKLYLFLVSIPAARVR